MKLGIIWVGRTATDYFQQPTNVYTARIRRYMPIDILEIPDLKNTKALDINQIRENEGVGILKQIKNDDIVILLDDKGRQYTSVEFAQWIERQSMASAKRILFVIGGAYGFSLDVYKRANGFISLSKMTFSHQIIRPIFLEQLYRSMTILKNEPYHHEESLWCKK